MKKMKTITGIKAMKNMKMTTIIRTTRTMMRMKEM